jgi:hypothetical protein
MGMARYAPAATNAAINEAYTVIRSEAAEPMIEISFSFIPLLLITNHQSNHPSPLFFMHVFTGRASSHNDIGEVVLSFQ